jgi:hypothetical protein
METANVEAVLVAPAQSEGDASSVGVLVPREAWVESWTPGPRVLRVKLWVPRGARQKLTRPVMKEPRGGGRSDRPGWRSDHHPLFLGWSDRLGSRSYRQQRWELVVVEARLDCVGRQSHHQPLSSVWSDHQRRSRKRTLVGGWQWCGHRSHTPRVIL